VNLTAKLSKYLSLVGSALFSVPSFPEGEVRARSAPPRPREEMLELEIGSWQDLPEGTLILGKYPAKRARADIYVG